MAAAATACSNNFAFHCFSSLSSSTSHNIKPLLPISSFACPNSIKPLKISRLQISHRTRNRSEHIFRLHKISCLVEDNSEAQSNSPKEASIDIKLPRRSLFVSFTCNACSARTQRFINKVAYERGTVFLQCAGCLQYHKFVDNLGLVVEYNFLEDGDIASYGDQT